MFSHKDPNEPIPEGEDGLWYDREQVAAMCPACAEKMKKLGIIRIRANVMFNQAVQAAVLNDGECVGCPE